MFLAIGSVLFCTLTVPKISVDSNIFNYFKSNNWINQDMRYFDEMPFKQISKILSTTEGALRASYHQAVKKIKNELEK